MSARKTRAGAGGPEAAEAQLKRRMRIARVLAVSMEDAVLGDQVWKRAVELDEEAERRMKARAEGRRGHAIVSQ